MLTTEQFLFIAFGAALVSAFYAAFDCRSLFALFQQEGYAGGAFLKGYCRKRGIQRRRYFLLALCAFLLCALADVCFSFLDPVYTGAIAALAFLLVVFLFAYASPFSPKIPARATPRLVRLAVCFFVLLFGVSFGALVGLEYAAQAIGNPIVYSLRFLPLTLLPLVFPFVLCLANLLMLVYEKPRSAHFVKKAKKKLMESGCVKVGITGSFGKTSVKNFARQFLEKKYRVAMTPASYNTPLGIARFVNEKGLDCDVFLAEMGARHAGDIAELCDMVQPGYGVVTGVCAQHLETFGSLEKIRAEKGTLARRVKTCILGATCAEMKGEGSLLEGEDFAAEDVVLSAEGVSFTLRIGDERAAVRTPLLGRSAAEDIALAAALAHALGVGFEEIAAAVPALEGVRHRLEKTEANGVVILDDSYNSNPEGAKNAVEALLMFGGRKFAVTPGLVELGEFEEKANFNLGSALAGLDRVILVGETLVLPVRQGYLAAGGEEGKISVVSDLGKAKKLLSEELAAGDAVLFLNDLPDKYL